MKHWFIGSFALLSAIGAANTVYSDDFQASTIGAEWTVTGGTPLLSVTPVGSRQFLGQFGNDSINLALNGLNAGQTYTVGFDLFVINSWDGYTGPGPDRFELLAGSTTLLDTTFSNTEETGTLQNYPSAFGGSGFAPGTGSDEYDTLGYTYYGNSVYKFGGSLNSAFNFQATGSSMTLTWRGSGLQGLGDESWGIDNVVVTDAVPEPATLTILAAAAAAAMARRRKKA